VKIDEDVAPNFGENRSSCFTKTTPRLTLPFSPSILWRKTKMVAIPHATYSPDLAPYDFSLFPEMKLKLKGRRFDTIEEIQDESQRVLDTVTEKGFQEAFQKWRRRWDRCLHWEEYYLEDDGGQ
jgi:hypothetical protein